MDVNQCVVVNEYGGCLEFTLSDTPDQAQEKFIGVYGPDATLENSACCVVRLVPVVVLGKPRGYWANETAQRIESTEPAAGAPVPPLVRACPSCGNPLARKAFKGTPIYACDHEPCRMAFTIHEIECANT